MSCRAVPSGRFEPSKDADRRKGVILDFFGPVTLWAQYAEGGYAVSEWQVVADDHRLEKHGDLSTVTIHFVEPTSEQQFPSPCEDCVETGGVSISVRHVFDEERIAFRINDPRRGPAVALPGLPVLDPLL